MKEKLTQIKEEGLQKINNAKTLEELQEINKELTVKKVL